MDKSFEKTEDNDPKVTTQGEYLDGKYCLSFLIYSEINNDYRELLDY